MVDGRRYHLCSRLTNISAFILSLFDRSKAGHPIREEKVMGREGSSQNPAGGYMLFHYNGEVNSCCRCTTSHLDGKAARKVICDTAMATAMESHPRLLAMAKNNKHLLLARQYLIHGLTFVLNG